MARGKVIFGTVDRYFVNDKEVPKAEYDAAFPDKWEPGEMLPAQLPECWPMVSEAVAVHPNQRAEAHADAIKKGVPTDFDQLGRPVFTDRGHRKKYMKAYGVHDRNGGYGD